jgi:hypothetical protein
MLHKIKTGGIEAYCSDLIVDNETNQYVYLLGVAGYQTTVKGILANMLKGESLSIEIKGESCWVERFSTNYLMQIKKMPSEYCHGITLIKMGANQSDEESPSREFLLINEDPLKVKEPFYSHLDQKTEVPLHPDWTDWLWKLFGEKGWITRLKTLVGKYDAYLINLHQEELSDEITEAIRKKVPEVINCMKRRE